MKSCYFGRNFVIVVTILTLLLSINILLFIFNFIKISQNTYETKLPNVYYAKIWQIYCTKYPQKISLIFLLFWLPQLTKSMGLAPGLHRDFRRDPDTQNTNADQGCAKYECGPGMRKIRMRTRNTAYDTVPYSYNRNPNVEGENSNKNTSTVLTKWRGKHHWYSIGRGRK